ncbi:MAG: hypothetical protein LBJ46_10250 [Planctomycetota bacterium]|jgi:hypothetical protein|nr:hypothetical protein [Planctomycetota bacterium]
MPTGRILYNFKKKGDRIKTIPESDITLVAEPAPEVPKSLSRVIDRRLARDPEHRYRDCTPLRDVFELVEF